MWTFLQQYLCRASRLDGEVKCDTKAAHHLINLSLQVTWFDNKFFLFAVVEK